MTKEKVRFFLSFHNIKNLLFSVGLSTVDININHYKIVVPLFGQLMLHQKKAQQFYTNFLILISLLSQSSISEEDI